LTIDYIKYILSADNSLIITNITPTDGVTYTCRTTGGMIVKEALIVDPPKTPDSAAVRLSGTIVLIVAGGISVSQSVIK